MALVPDDQDVFHNHGIQLGILENVDSLFRLTHNGISMEVKRSI
jgi:hypothetical protein